MKEVVGHVTCPFCKRRASVHQNARGQRLRYIRCGEVLAGASSGCGTIQIYGASGQAWIDANLQPAGGPPPVPPADPAPAPEPEPIPKPEMPPAPVSSSVWSRFTKELTAL